MSSLKKYGLAICGVGRAGTIHTGNCYRNPKVQIKYFVEIDIAKAEQLKNSFGLDDTKVVSVDEIDTVLNDESVDGVIIATVTGAHQELVCKCINAKKAIFCEKPIALELHDTVTCYEMAAKANVPIFCAFNRRFDKSHACVRNAARLGEIGKIHMVRCISRDSPLPSDDYLKISGGIFHDCAVHDIDMITWILDEYPISVFTHAHAFRKSISEMGDVDTVSITMKFASGSIAQIDISRFAAYGYDQRVEVFGELGMLESINQHKTSTIKSTKDQVSRDLILHSFPQRYAEGYASELEHFLDVIEGAPSIVTGKNVMMVSLIASACEESHKCGKPISIDEQNLTFKPSF
ncbi:myo-inositol 2-dehydrogenase [Hydra vulgaris]|uniref:myo-inositol 2-dehydrogenase n=1 Tax=Hydra vulgaris TaxID=6087 RepID=UPI00019259D3|nr:myo-inositol 2-dehydrogenase [Hydra vulgaris]